MFRRLPLNPLRLVGAICCLVLLAVPLLSTTPLASEPLQPSVSRLATESVAGAASRAVARATASLALGMGPAGGARETCQLSLALVSAECQRSRAVALDKGNDLAGGSPGGWHPGPSFGQASLPWFGGAAVTYDGHDGYVLLFGGTYSPDYGNGVDFLATTWKFQNNTWTNLTATAGVPPRARAGALMAYDATDGYVVLFGGSYSEFCSEGQNGTAPTQPAGANCALYPGPFQYSFFPNDTWSFAGGVWSQLHPTVAPPGRIGAQLGYDALDGYAVLFGGLTGQGETTNLGDTWTFAGGNWTDRTSALPVAPQPRGFGGMAWDAGNQRLILFGGATYLSSPPWGANASFTYLRSDTWGFSNGTWTNLTSVQPSTPSPRWQFEMSAGPNGSVVLFGGESYVNSSLEDTWAFQNGSWSLLSALSSSPPPVAGQTMVFDPHINATLITGGGLGLGGCNQCTWEFGGLIPAGAAASSIPTLTLSALAATGSAPVNVSVTASAANGRPPYALTYTITTAAAGGSGTNTIGPRGCPEPAAGGNGAWNASSANCPGPSWNGSALRGTTLQVFSGEVIFIDGEVVDSAGMSSEAAVFATVTPNFSASARLDSSGSSPLLGPVDFVSNATGGTLPYRTAVEFGDGSSAERGGVGLIAHFYAAAGVYYATITVSDYFGLSERTWLKVTVEWSALSLSALFAGASASTGLFVGIGVVVQRRRREDDAGVSEAWYRELAQTPITDELPPRIP
ncbi:MAG: PKD domain-containing protein [Thermoplasmata archaeon]|nr:PKD domain-containing protein [Thermoplasmata archaeon]